MQKQTVIFLTILSSSLLLNGCGSSTSDTSVPSVTEETTSNNTGGTTTGSDTSGTDTATIDDNGLDTLINEFAELRINEIVAKDANDGADWIEFFASGQQSVYLADYQIADEAGELVALPDVTLVPGEYYKVYATGEQSSDNTSVGFKLGSSDEVRLYLGTDLVDAIEWSKDDAMIGYSYGRYPDGSDALQVLTPSPEAANRTQNKGPLVINEVVARQLDGSNDWFELYNTSSTTINLSAYSVVDGTDDLEPVALPDVEIGPGEYLVIEATDEESTTYSVPFKLGKEDELTLTLADERVDYIEWDESDVPAGYSYGLSTDGAWSHDTLLPTKAIQNTLVDFFVEDSVESIYFTLEPDTWQDLLDNAEDEEYRVSSVTYQGVTLDEVGIRAKGNSSLAAVVRSGGERFSFNIDINEYVSGQKLLGKKKFVLNNMYNDPSYMREYIAYELMDEMGVAAPERSFVNVYVNDELKGLYLLVEFVNSQFLESHFTNTEGDLYKPDGTGSDLQYIDDDINSYAGVELKTNEESSDQGAFINFVSTMASGDPTELVDFDSVLRYLAVSVALSNLDSYHGALSHNYYLYEQDGVFSFLPWDLNEAFGSFSMGCNNADIRGLYIDEPTSGALASRPLLAHVLGNSEYLEQYHSYLSTLIDGPLADENFAQRVSEIADLIGEHVQNDPTAFYSYSQFLQNQNTTVERFYGLTSFMSYRVANMTEQLNGTLPSAGNGSGYCN